MADRAAGAGGPAFAAAWLWALASWNPQAGQEATHRPATKCSAGCSWSGAGPRSSGPGMAASGSQWWWVMAVAAA